MSVGARALSAKRMSNKSAALSLMCSESLHVVAAFVSEYFPKGSEARPVAEIYEYFADDLRILRSEGFKLDKGPQHYINYWVKNGWLTRRAGTSATGETIEPSEETLAVVDTLNRWDAPQRTVTASRIETISQALHRPGRDADTSIQSRLELLEQQQADLETQIEQTSMGEFDVLSPVQVKERIGDILDLAADIPADFA